MLIDCGDIIVDPEKEQGYFGNYVIILPDSSRLGLWLLDFLCMGQVENFVKVAKSQYFIPMPSVSSLDELNQWQVEKCISYETTTVPRTSLTVREASL